MKKTLVALASLAATGAFAQVTISGTFDPSLAFQKTTYANATSVSNNYIRNNSQGTSQITFKGVEDLGNGLKASFLLENDFDTRYDANGPEGVSAAGVRGVNLGSGGGEQYLALEGGFGKLALGSANTPTLGIQAARNAFGTKLGSGFNGVLGTGHVRSNNSMVYTSPNMSGFTFAAAYGLKHDALFPATASAQAVTNTGAASTNSDNATAQGSVSDLGLTYANGPLMLGVSMWNTDALGATPAVRQINGAVNYDFGVAKIQAGFHTEKQDTYTSATRTAGADANGFNVSFAIPQGNLTWLLNYATLTDGLLARNANPLDKNIFGLGVKYMLSKNTSIYARYVSETNETLQRPSLRPPQFLLLPRPPTLSQA